MVYGTGVPASIVERAQDVLRCKTKGELIAAIESKKAPPEENLLDYFCSVNDWTSASDEMVDRFLELARMGDFGV